MKDCQIHETGPFRGSGDRRLRSSDGGGLTSAPQQPARLIGISSPSDVLFWGMLRQLGVLLPDRDIFLMSSGIRRYQVHLFTTSKSEQHGTRARHVGCGYRCIEVHSHRIGGFIGHRWANRPDAQPQASQRHELRICRFIKLIQLTPKLAPSLGLIHLWEGLRKSI